MATQSGGVLEDEVWQTVQAMNKAWTSGDVEELKDYFHEGMVAITATDRERLEGREACIASWSAFAKAAKIRSWKETDPKVQFYGNTAVVTYYFDISFDMGGQTIMMAGRDMFVMVKENGKWWAVADQFSAYPG
ncbi:MAG: nuclear transport factor 2 family protein [Nitrospirae bacterium]|nr:nuclear transport factor 2 family protein [Nitrospirota bacterium]